MGILSKLSPQIENNFVNCPLKKRKYICLLATELHELFPKFVR